MKGKQVIGASVLTLLMLLCINVGAVFAAPEIVEFELEIEMKDHSKYDIEYEAEDDYIDAKHHIPGAEKLFGEEAKAMIDPLLEDLSITPDSDRQELVQKIIAYYDLDENQIDEFELEVEFSNREKIEIEFE